MHSFKLQHFSTNTQEDLLDVLYPDIKGEPQPLPKKYMQLRKRGSKTNNLSEYKNNEVSEIEFIVIPKHYD